MRLRKAPRGQPLFALSLVLGGWIGVRALFWDVTLFAPPLPLSPAGTLSIAGAIVGPEEAVAIPLDGGEGARQSPPTAFVDAATPSVWSRACPVPTLMPARLAGGGTARPAPPKQQIVPSHFSPLGFVPSLVSDNVPTRVASADQTMWMTGLQDRIPASFAVPFPGSGTAPDDSMEREAQRPKRWSSDGWVLLRRGGEGALAAGAAPATYGASQAGGVLRYRLSPQSRHRPAAYLRTTAALNGSAEREAAIGLSARPLAEVPVVAAAEVRATSQPWGTLVRPAAMVVTELPPFGLPHRLRGEAYLQAGYVGGRFSTPFIDGQLRVDRSVATVGRTELRAGFGGWAGAQKGASRLDVGPAATMGMGLGEGASARLAVDWRFRIGGDAAPSSGPALTLSAGF